MECSTPPESAPRRWRTLAEIPDVEEEEEAGGEDMSEDEDHADDMPNSPPAGAASLVDDADCAPGVLDCDAGCSDARRMVVCPILADDAVVGVRVRTVDARNVFLPKETPAWSAVMFGPTRLFSRMMPLMIMKSGGKPCTDNIFFRFLVWYSDSARNGSHPSIDEFFKEEEITPKDDEVQFVDVFRKWRANLSMAPVALNVERPPTKRSSAASRKRKKQALH